MQKQHNREEATEVSCCGRRTAPTLANSVEGSLLNDSSQGFGNAGVWQTTSPLSDITLIRVKEKKLWHFLRDSLLSGIELFSWQVPVSSDSTTLQSQNQSCVLTVEMGSHPAKRVPVQLHNSFLNQRSRRKFWCDFTSAICVQCENPVF